MSGWVGQTPRSVRLLKSSLASSSGETPRRKAKSYKSSKVSFNLKKSESNYASRHRVFEFMKAITSPYYRYRNDEIFRRMKTTTFVQLIIQVHRIASLELEDAYSIMPDTPAGGDRPDTVEPELQQLQETLRDNGRTSPTHSLALTEGDYGAPRETSRSTLQSVARGVGELDVNGSQPSAPNPFIDDSCPYLLLDVREQDDYDLCHIITALNYPTARLSRAMNYETKEMWNYKNKEGKIIVLYDDDEKLAHAASTTLTQRGYDNLFMLSGGLKVAAKMFPQGLITGTIPPHISGSKSRPKQIIPALQKTFTEEDVTNIEDRLDTALEDRSSGSSRLSQASTSSRSNYSRATARSQASIRSNLSDKPPFKPP